METVLAENPDAWQGYYNVACFEALTGNDDAAIEQLERAIELDPQALEYAQRRRGLRPAARPSRTSRRERQRAHLRPQVHVSGRTSRWAMVRTHFDIQSFGVNAYIAEEPGLEVIGEHDELGKRAGKHEELYFVSSGHATFTVNGDEIDAPAGTFVFVRDPAAKRKARRSGGRDDGPGRRRQAGRGVQPSPWERNARRARLFREQGVREGGGGLRAAARREARRRGLPLQPGLRREPAGAQGAGARASARSRSRPTPTSRRARLEDPDFDAIRDEPEFSAITGQPDTTRASRSAGTGSASGRATSSTAP